MIYAHYIDFHNKYPDISVKFTTADTSVMFDMLDRNEADAIITLDSHSYRKDYIIAKEEALPMHFVTKDFIESGELCYLDVVDMNIDIWKQLIYHKNKWMSKSLKAFISYIKDNEFSN